MNITRSQTMFHYIVLSDICVFVVEFKHKLDRVTQRKLVMSEEKIKFM